MLRLFYFTFFIFILFVSFLFPQQASAAIFNIGPSDEANLIFAINDSNSNGVADTIILTSSDYTLTSSDNSTYAPTGLPLITSKITIEGNGATITRESLAPTFRIIAIDTLEIVTFNNVTLSNGYDTSDFGGGAIYIKNGTLNINNSNIINNTARFKGGGGGINFQHYSSLNINNSNISNNRAIDNGSGAGIHGEEFTTSNIFNSTIIDNEAENIGGAVFNRGNLTITNSSVSNNEAWKQGGGYAGDGILTITDSNIANNVISTHEHGFGGGIWNFGGTFNINNSRIINNTATVNGGGIYNTGSGSITYSCISGNSFYSIYNTGSTIATNNYWGDPSGPSGNGPGTGDSISGNVEYFPFETTCPIPDQPDSLDVPYFSQIDPLWSNNVYDHTGSTIGELGCALTSASMVLNYHGLDQLPNGTPLTPASLNDWLNSNGDGFWRHGLVSWNALMRLSKKLNHIDPIYTVLDYRKIKPPDFPLINQILTDNQDPLIFEENKPDSSSGVHFPLANGIITSTEEYSILDPLDETRTSFIMFPGQLNGARYLYPTNTNLSSIILHLDEKLNVVIEDPNNLSEGNDGTIFLDDLDYADYSLENPIYNPSNPSQKTSDPFWEFIAYDPITGKYKLSFNSQKKGLHSFELYTYDENAEVNIFKKHVYTDGFNPTTFTINYIQESSTSTLEFDDSNTLTSKIWDLWDEGLIYKNGHAQLLTRALWLAQKAEGTLLYDTFVNLFKSQLHRHQKHIDSDAYEFLLQEVKSL